MSKVNIPGATVPASMSGVRAMSVWSDMPMGPPDPILGLTGESDQARVGQYARKAFPLPVCVKSRRLPRVAEGTERRHYC